jgi:2-phosphosulfolactate phosphatase
MTDWHRQFSFGLRLDWGTAGAAALGPAVAALVIIDVLSFTTAVTVAAEAGTRVYPYPRRDASAAEFARRRNAELAVGRAAATPASPWSLSPAALRRAPAPAALVLPSPNGSAIAAAAASAGSGGPVVVAACLRNARATGRWLARRGLGTAARPVAVIAAGERWPDGSLRPAVEDLLGAGAVLAAAVRFGGGPLSPEAAAALAAFAGAGAARTDTAGPATAAACLGAALAASASGRELRAAGFADDVAVAAELDSAAIVPVLSGGAFRAESVPPENG